MKKRASGMKEGDGSLAYDAGAVCTVFLHMIFMRVIFVRRHGWMTAKHRRLGEPQARGFAVRKGLLWPAKKNVTM